MAVGPKPATNERRAKRANPRGEVWIDRVREVLVALDEQRLHVALEGRRYVVTSAMALTLTGMGHG